jgi:hypothetical protein
MIAVKMEGAGPASAGASGATQTDICELHLEAERYLEVRLVENRLRQDSGEGVDEGPDLDGCVLDHGGARLHAPGSPRAGVNCDGPWGRRA